MSEHKNLAQKFVKIMESVQHVPKNGRNTHFNYDYVLESDALDKVRSEFVKHGVAFFPSVNAVEKTGDITGVHLQMLLVDSESGEEMTLTWYGEGQDKQDKGAYKAYTGGLKYWVLKTFLVGTGDDPERDQPQPTKEKAGEVASKKQLNFANKLIENDVFSDGEKAEYAETAYKFTQKELLTHQGEQKTGKQRMSEMLDYLQQEIETREDEPEPDADGDRLPFEN